MLHFDTDYMRGAHPEIIRRLAETNMMQTPGYGADGFTASAREKIRRECRCPDADVFFLVGGTQTNATVIDGILRGHEGVIAAESAHINVHESGAIEASGHKVLVLPSHDGKLLADEVDAYITAFYADEAYEHMVAPGMVYISYPSELGTLYSREELAELKKVCGKHGVPLFIDGARLAYGLAAQPELSLHDIASLCDVFYFGGTKTGALFGEAVVVTRPGLIGHITQLVKRHGALLAKGRLLGLQFDTLFTDGLYLKIARNAIETAMILKKGFVEKGYRQFIDSPTNQQFFVMPNTAIDRLRGHCSFETWGPRGESESVVRFVTDWGTSAEDVHTLLDLL